MSTIKPLLKKFYSKLIWQQIKRQIINKRKKLNGLPCVFFIATPTHGNLGDQAIVYAQKKFFEDIGLGENIVEIHRWQYTELRKSLKSIIDFKDIIIIDGGGNVGTLWIEEEYKMRDIIRRFPQNRIFIFPQTAYFSQDETGQTELNLSRQIYTRNKNLILFARDRNTEDLLRQEMSGLKVLYTPDIVPYITDAEEIQERKGVLLCMRSDKEKKLNATDFGELKQFLELMGVEYKITETVVNKKISPFQREKELRKKWGEFSAVQLIITDRLHGMIFSAITGTPCIALDNTSHKVYGGYEWLSYLPYVKYCKNVDEVKSCVKDMIALKPQRFNNKPLLPYYEQMQTMVREAVDGIG